jgi:hypothetical protein
VCFFAKFILGHCLLLRLVSSDVMFCIRTKILGAHKANEDSITKLNSKWQASFDSKC